MTNPLHPYPAPAQRTAELHWLVGRLGGTLHTYGHSVSGRPLHAVRISSVQTTRHAVVVCANIHGVEFISNRVAMEFLRRLPGLGLLERATVWVLPCLNPDGHAATWDCAGSAPLASMRCNASGVDLNRNFPMPWLARPRRIPFAGGARPGTATHRGTAPASEPEVSSLIRLLQDIQPHAGVNLHSFMGTLIQPRVCHRADHQSYGRLIRATQTAQRHRYRRLAMPLLDVFTGEQEDYQHHVLQCWSVCMETFPVGHALTQRRPHPSIFWRFNPTDPWPWVQQDVAGIAAFLHAALDLPRPPRRRQALQCHETWSGRDRASQTEE